MSCDDASIVAFSMNRQEVKKHAIKEPVSHGTPNFGPTIPVKKNLNVVLCLVQNQPIKPCDYISGKDRRVCRQSVPAFLSIHLAVSSAINLVLINHLCGSPSLGYI